MRAAVLSRAPARAIPAAALPLAAAAVAVWLAAPYVTLSPDARYSLAWGAELLRGGAPDLTAPSVPTPHPLPIGIGALLSALGPRAAADAYSALAVLAFLLLVYAVFRLARGLGGVAAGALAAALVATRPRFDFFAAHSFIDIPFAALVVLAAALVAERPRGNSTRALALLAAAGLLRPEAWLFSAVYAAWLLLRDGGAEDARRVVPLAAAAPVAWTLFDLAFTGDPLHSLTGTRDNAVHLHRPHGVDELLPRLDVGIRSLIGWLPAIAGAVVAVWCLIVRRERRFGVATAVVVTGLAAFAALAVAELPLNDRYLMVPAATLGALAGASLGGFPRSPVLVAALALALGGALADASDDRRETSDMLTLSKDKHEADTDLERLLARRSVRAAILRCPRVEASGSGRAATAALLKRDVAEVRISRSPLPQGAEALLSTSSSVPPGTPGAIREGAWTFISGCEAPARSTSRRAARAPRPRSRWQSPGRAA
jgi:hypothetical protein